MIKKTFLLVILVILIGTNHLCSQVNKKEFKRDSYITFNVLSPIVYYSPRWNIGYYKEVAEKWTISLEIGFGSYGTSINFAKGNGWIDKDYLIFEVSPEVIYRYKTKGKLKEFISSNLFYINHSDNLKNRIYKNENDSLYYNFSSADYKRHKYGLNINYGIIYNFSDRFGIISKVGLGIKIRSVNFSNIVNPILKDPNEGENETLIPEINDFLEIEGVDVKANFNFHFKILYKFN